MSDMDLSHDCRCLFRGGKPWKDIWLQIQVSGARRLIRSQRPFTSGTIRSPYYYLLKCTGTNVLHHSFMNNKQDMKQKLSHKLIFIYFFLQVKNGQWGKTVLEINTKRTQSLPIMDIAVYDVGGSDQDFNIELGDVCFFN